MKILAYLYILYAAVSWGAIGVFTKQTTQLGINELEMLFLKVTISTVILFLLILLKDRTLFRLKKISDLKYFIGTGILSYIFFSWCYMKAINSISIGIAASLLYTAPGYVMLFSALFFHEKLHGRKILSLILTVTGCILVTEFWNENSTITVFGLGLGILSGLGYALYSIFGTLAIRRGYSSITIAFYTFLLSAIFSSFFVNPISFFGYVTESSSWPFAIAFALSTATLPYLAYTTGLKWIPASSASIIATIEPVVAALLGIFMFHESATFIKFAGIILVFFSVILINLPTKNSR
ncbi:MAG: EamA family transporter [Clostridiales bacterium]|nr:EamA family transporter [Clostridiales bacterium]